MALLAPHSTTSTPPPKIRPREVASHATAVGAGGESDGASATPAQSPRHVLLTNVLSVVGKGLHVFTDIADARFDVVRAIIIETSEIDGGHMATFADAHVVAYGETIAEALSELQGNLVDTYDSLAENESALGAALRRDFAALRHVLIPID